MKIENTEITIPTVELKLGKEVVKVKQYISSWDKSQIITALTEMTMDRQQVDQPKLDALFNVFVALNYTDIEFESRDQRELMGLYDYLEVNEYMGKIIQAIPEIEYNALIGYLKSTVDDFDKNKRSAMALFANLAEYGPALMEKISEISKEIDIEALQYVGEIVSKMD